MHFAALRHLDQFQLAADGARTAAAAEVGEIEEADHPVLPGLHAHVRQARHVRQDGHAGRGEIEIEIAKISSRLVRISIPNSRIRQLIA